NKNLFKRGDVVIGNNDFGKYKGELQLILQDCTDERKNKVGRIKEDEIILLDFIEPWSKFKII
ncbi:PTS-associated protein, partial [Clostridioides difficile]